MNRRLTLISQITAAITLFAVICPAIAKAQMGNHVEQKYYAQQKPYVPLDESNQEEADQGGYQAPPPSGAMEGPSRSLGLSGGEIEFPALRLKLPRVRLPSLSYFITPPRMHMDSDVAPHVQNVQQHVAVPTGAPTPGSSNQEAPGKNKGAPQKYSYRPYTNGQYGPITPTSMEAMEVVRMKNEMMQLERRLDAKLDALTNSIEKLAVSAAKAGQSRAAVETTSRDMVKLPPVSSDVTGSQVSHLRYTKVTPVAAPRRLPTFARRLPNATQ